MQSSTDDKRTWGGWSEIVLLAAKFDFQVSVFWRESAERAVLRAQTKGSTGPPRTALLYDPAGHYEALELPATLWAELDAHVAAAPIN